jgi:hypothetical protein
MSKVTQHWIAVRCAFTPSGQWHRFDESIKNHAVAKRKAFEFLLDQAFEAVHVT